MVFGEGKIHFNIKVKQNIQKHPRSCYYSSDLTNIKADFFLEICSSGKLAIENAKGVNIF